MATLEEQTTISALQNLKRLAIEAAEVRSEPITMEGPEESVRFLFRITPELMVELIDTYLIWARRP